MADRATYDEPQTRQPQRRAPVQLDIQPAGRGFDLSLLIGLLTAFGLVLAALIIGGSVTSFYNVPALLIVFLGTFAVTMVAYSIGEIFMALGEIGRTLFPRDTDARRAAERVMTLSAIARDRGVLALDSVLDMLGSEPFLRTAVAMAVDGASAEQIERVMQREIDATEERRERMAGVLRRAAEVAPSMGLIGTLIGLIQLLANLNDPSSIGPAMAVALLTTFYGAILAYMVFSPIAAKLERNAADERFATEIYLAGAASLARQESPHVLETLLNAKLPPSRRLDYYG